MKACAWTVLPLIPFLFLACGDDEDARNSTSATSTTTSSTAAVGTGGSGATGGSSQGAGGSGNAGGSITMTACDADTCDLSFAGSGFSDVDGKTIYWGIQEQGEQSGTLTHSDSAVIQGGSFSFDAPGVLDKGSAYNLNYFVDTNDNADCESNVDLIWRLSLANVQSHLAVAVGYDTANLSNLGCSGHP